MASASTPPWASTASGLDLMELMFEFYLSEGSFFRQNTSVPDWLPTSNYQLVVNSGQQDPIRVAGRYYHYVQATGIAGTSGDVVTIQGNLTGISKLNDSSFVNINVTPINPATSQATITANGIYFFTGNLYYIQAAVTPGTNTGSTNVYLMSRPA